MRTRTALLAAGVAVALLAGGCTDDGEPTFSPGGDEASKAPSVTLNVTPADKATDVPVSAEIAVKAEGGAVAKIELADANGQAVEGAMRSDGSSWVPAEPLSYKTTYTATITAKPDDGAEERQATTFTTMARPGNRMGAHIYMADNAVYGQAMPLVVEFDNGGVPAEHRATVERRLFVRSEPEQEGSWHWDSNTQIEYRPREYWEPGTKLDIRLGLGGLPIGDGRYGQVDITIVAAIDKTKRVMEIDNASKRLVASQDGRQVKSMPVSLGKPSAPSFSGNMVIMEKLAKTVFDSSTYGTPVDSADGYRTKVQYAQRLTWDGQFVHAAPWSVAAQGRRNVSHGCVNLSTANGQWLFGWAKIGDPIVVRGTGHPLKQGNGWTVWDLEWDEVVAGSALR
jgi:lipoprotein-anchoring transpeptidase ErfK/SrfK